MKTAFTAILLVVLGLTLSSCQILDRFDPIDVGQVAPKFTLLTLRGDIVTLDQILENNELVLVDFWASWCGWCIESFPTLKQIYSLHKDQGFEIVSISLDSNREDWEEGSETNDLPWTDIGDMENRQRTGFYHAPTAIAYGVNRIPKMFLLNSEGIVILKDPSTEKLRKWLTSNLDNSIN